MRRGIDRAVTLGFKALEAVMVLLLASMVGMVFFNVVLRYFFDAGISISDEMSRFMFVWLTFVGAVVVHHENSHLGVETLVQMLPDLGRKACMAVADLMALACCAVFFWGTWKFDDINASNVAPITGIPMTWVYNIGYFTSLAIGLMLVLRLVRLATGRLDEQELKIFAGDHFSEEAAAAKRNLD